MSTPKGYTRVPNDLMRDQSISLAARAVWVIISGVSNDVCPTVAQWMQWSGLTRNTWRRCVRELTAAGWLIAVKQAGNRISYRTAVAAKDQTTAQPKAKLVPAKRTEPEEINQQDNITGMRDRMRQEVMTDLMIETGCRSVGITEDVYRRLSQEIFNDWTFQGLDNHEWNKSHFLSVLRIKAKELKRNGDNKQQQVRKPGQLPGGTQAENPLAGYPTYNKTGS